MLKKLPFPALVFFAASFFGLPQLYHAIDSNAGWRLFFAALACGFVLGLAVQACFVEPFPRWRVAIAAFSGSFVLWLPVVISTYGFALRATPIFVAYAAAVTIGTLIASRIRRAR